MIMRAMRPLGAVAILVVGGIHLQQYVGADYRAAPTVGTLFLLNAIASAVVGAGLLAPIDRFAPSRQADAAIGLLAAGALAIAVGSLIALFISESASLFGFTESGYGGPIVAAIVAEVATIVLLGPVAIASLASAVSNRRSATARRRGRPGTRLDHSAAR